jgi:CRISPR-associated protein Cas1
VPEAFRVAGAHAKGKLDRPPEMATRHACRDAFRRSNILARLIPAIEETLEAGGLARPEPPADAVGPAFADPAPSGDPGMRQ